MGVIGAFCQLCRLPLNVDHYVPDGESLRIFRSCHYNPDEWAPDDRVVRPEAHHAWLGDVVAITRETSPRILRGTVEDATLVDTATGATSFIWTGAEDALAFHAYCYAAIGRPETVSAAVRGLGTLGWALVERYGGQLFELATFVAHGHGWALTDAARSRARIEAIAADARRPIANPRLASVRDILAADRDWSGFTMYGKDHEPKLMVHYREGILPGVDVSGYSTLVWAMKEYDGGFAKPTALQALEAFHVEAKRAIEADHTAITALVTIAADQLQFLAYTRDEAATRAALDALPVAPGTGAVDYDNEVDPAWSVYFDQMDPRLYTR